MNITDIGFGFVPQFDLQVRVFHPSEFSPSPSFLAMEGLFRRTGGACEFIRIMSSHSAVRFTGPCFDAFITPG